VTRTYEGSRPRARTKPNETLVSKSEIRYVGSPDIVIFGVVAVLVLFGIIMVGSASNAMAATRFGDPHRFVRQNIIWASIGFVGMWFLARFSYELIRPLALWAYITSAGLLVAVIVVGIGAGGATRWVSLPVIGQFQPSELARPALIFMLAYLIESFPNTTRTWKGIFALGIIVGFLAGLIALPGGLSVAIIVTAIGIAMIAVASPKFWQLVGIGAIGGAIVGGVLWFQYAFGDGWRGGRFGAWLDPWSDHLGRGFQTIQSLYAIASGGWFGLGLGGSHQSSFIPEPHNDIIFALVIEEFGFFGAFIILLLFGVLIWRGILVAMRAPDTFSSMSAFGIVFAIGIQAIINVAVVTNSIPNTGVNLPFISYGGTSLVVSMAMMGVLLNISRYSVYRKKPRDAT